MAKKKQETPQVEEQIGLDVTLNKSEAFIEKNWKMLAGGLLAIIAVVVGIYVWKSIAANKEEKAQNAIAAAQMNFAQQKFEEALNGDGAKLGFLKVMNEYSGTKTANIAKLYAAACYAKTDKVDEAIKMFESYDGQDDEIVSPMAIVSLADCYITKGNTEKGIELLLKAAKEANNAAISPLALLKAGEIYESQGKNDKALELYKQIKDNYSEMESGIVAEIDMYIERTSK